MDESTIQLLSSYFSSESITKLAHDMFIFGFAAAIYAGRLKKEIASVVKALNDVSVTLRQDLEGQTRRIVLIEHGLDNLNAHVKGLTKGE